MLKARSRMLMESPFFGTLSLKLKLTEDNDIKTLATDGVRLLFSPKFIEGLTPLELIGGVAHEVMHCVLNHHTRRGALFLTVPKAIATQTLLTKPTGKLP
mgnify:CR=1 FL=1